MSDGQLARDLQREVGQFMNETESTAAMITAEFEYTSEETTDALRALVRRGVSTKRLWLAVAGWVILIAIAIGLFSLINDRPTAVNPPLAAARATSSPSPGWSFSLFPWFFIVFFVLFLMLRRLGVRTRKDNPLLNCRWTMVADENGLVMSQPLEHSQQKWARFSEMRETQHLFLLMLARGHAVPIPKRAFRSEQDVDAFRALVQCHVAPQLSAFPVLPVR